MNEDIYEKNVRDLQEQLQTAYTHIDELNEIKRVAKKLTDAHDQLSLFSKCSVQQYIAVENAIEELKEKL